MTHVPHHRSLQLSSKKRALLHTRLQAENVKLTPTQIIPHREHTGPVPLSFAQQRLWFLHQLEPDNAFYNICRAFFLTGALDTPVLKQCLDEIVRRHEALRTTFLDIEGRPFQLIAPTLRLSLPVIDLEALSAMEQASEVDRFSLQEACQAFDLTRGPLLRVRLFHLGDEEHVILLTLHHSISDGWSMGVFFREFAALYTAYVTHTPSPLSDLPVQYADFAVWQREGRQEHLLDEQQSYWRGQLDTLPNLQLPLDYPRPAVQSFRGAVQHFVLPKTLTKALTALGLREECTLFMVLLAAFQVLLSRYTRQVDIAVGSLVANRRRTELESLIGFFANTLVLRTDLSGDPPFLELLKRVREVTLDAYTHQDVPFERLVEELKPDRDLSRNPLVQVAFSLQNAPAQDLELSGLKLKLAVIHTKTAKFDLNLMLSEKPEGLAGALEYNTDLFDASTISRLRTHFQTLLEGIVASPERPLSRLSLLTEAERHALTPRKHSQAASTPRACLHHLFEEQVQKIPDAIALVHEDHHLTYHQLNQHANRLARRLQTLGVGPEVRVGICVERSFEMIIGIVAILKAGGSYVPLDPDYPSERLVFMLADASISILLTQQRHLLALPEHAVQGVSLVDIHESLAEEASTATPVSEVRVANAAYVIYTSGSTGAPKGTVISHGNVARLLDVTQQWFRFHEQDIWTLFHSYAFDFSVWELWGALRYGGKLVIVPYLVSRSPQEFYQLLYEEQVTVLNQTPTAFSQLVHAEELSTQQWSLALRFVIFGGEALNFASLQSWFQRHGDRSPQLVNMYGITETTVHVTGYLLTTEDVIRGSSSIIGRTLPDLQEYVLDQHLDLVPVGIPGELYIGGEGLARGYLNRPELTAERFVPHPFSMQPGARLYRTGDLVRWTWEKNLEYLGRVDQQVKLRGFRIELREIETVLCQYPTISEAVVLLREERTGDRRLVAYIVSAPGQEISLSDVQQFLRQKLPAHMLPTGIVVLDHWPLTSNGKLNRQALPAPDASRYLSEKEYTPPRTPVEELLAGIWMDLLGIEQVSIHDDFFALGGHSLLATQVLARIRSLWQVDLPLRSLFSSPTISSLALLINQCLQAEQGLSIPPLRPQPRPDLLPLSFAQQRLWFLDQLAPGNPFYLIPFALHLDGPLQVAALQQSLRTIVSRHEALRTTFLVQQGQPVQHIASSEHATQLVVTVLDLSLLPPVVREQQAHALVGQQAQRPFQLSQELPLRASLLRLGVEEHLLLLTMHHIAFDGWSAGVFYRELSACYHAYTSGVAATLAPLPIQYADYTLWQRQWFQGAIRERQLDYWRQQLAELPPLALPADFPRPPVETFRGSHYTFEVSAELLAQLKALNLHERVTLFMVLLAAYLVVLMRHSGQNDIAVGIPVANRTSHETEDLIGFFVNTLVLRAQVEGTLTFRELLQRVREVTLEAYEYQDLPFERLVEELRPERTLTHNPLCQVCFQLQNTPRESLTFPGLLVRQWKSDNETAKVDLLLSLREDSQRLSATLEYSTDLFLPGTISRFADHYMRVLEHIVTSPVQPVGQLPLWSEAERQQIVEEWNTVRKVYPHEHCVHHLFERQAEQTPDAVALVFEEQHLTYSEMNRQANQLAHILQKWGVGPEVRVGICLERSSDMVIALLAIFKAGGAYVPLDPNYPLKRLAFLMNDAQIVVLLTQEALMTRLPSHHCQVLCLDRDKSAWASAPATSCAGKLPTQTLAYVIYTSGSTGLPKGAAICHQGLVHALSDALASFDPGSQHRMIQLASISFDASVLEIFLALLSGGTLCLVSRESLLSSVQLAQLLREQAITSMAITPSLLKTLGQEALPSLQTLIVGGEACSAELANHWGQGRHMYNVYAPTETTIYTTRGECSVPLRQAPLIGKPIANAQVYVLDQQMQLVPVGVAGELYVGGDGLARGYLGRPELTAERFVPHPLSNEAGVRLYRTGDLARYHADGQLEFLGRLDEQIKLRGYRIELGEIEAVLRQHPLVREAAVIAYEKQEEEKHLVAYFVADLTQVERADAHEQTPVASQQVQHWQQLYEQTYQREGGQVLQDTTFNLVGWNDSYTGQPIPAEEMREWLEDILAVVQEAQPRRILEIGCGTGLLLFRLASRCEHYYGTDFSATALQGIRKQVEQRPELTILRERVTLWKRQADDFGGLVAGQVDTVLLNSVVQYFPNVEYLLRVLEGALALLPSGGRIIVGDVRSLPLLETFHASVQLERAPVDWTLQQVLQQVQRKIQQEKELVLDPQLFQCWARASGKIRRVEIRLKRGRAQNELTRFRYQVVLHVGEPATLEETTVTPGEEELNWSKQIMTLERLQAKLQQQQPHQLRLLQIPNRRLSKAIQTVRWLYEQPGTETVKRWQAELAKQVLTGIDPEALWELAERVGYQVHMQWERQKLEGSYSVVLTRNGSTSWEDREERVTRLEQGETFLDWQQYANQPLRAAIQQRVVPQIQQYVQERLPTYMIPWAFVLLDELPLTSHGKLDRRTLPAPDGVNRSDLGVELVAPRTPEEELLRDMWTQVLRCDPGQVSIHDDFFALGGHSLLATQVLARIRSLWQVDLPLRSLFSSPTISSLVLLINQCLQAEQGLSIPPLRPQPRPDLLPLSFAQQRLWFLDQLAPGNPSYLIPFALHLDGPLQVVALQQSLRTIVSRHEALRTTFLVQQGQPVQHIASSEHATQLVVTVLDLSLLPPVVREQQAHALLGQQAQRPFQLSQELPLRASLLRLGVEEHLLLLTMHHIAFDGWSAGVFYRELSACYHAYTSGVAATLAPLPIQYADYTLWQRQWFQGAIRERQLDYWRQQLRGLAPLELPTDHVRPPVQTFCGAQQRMMLPLTLLQQMKELSRREGTTPFMTLLTAFQVLLARYSGQEDIVVGTPIANRTQAELESLVGFFVNTLVLRSDLSGNPSFAQLLQKVRKVCLDAYVHQDLPFEKLVEMLQPERDLSRSPLFQVMFQFQPLESNLPLLPGLTVRRFTHSGTTTKFDLSLALVEAEQGLSCVLEYSTDLFEASTVQRVLEHWNILLQKIVAHPEQHLSSLSLLTEAEWRQQVVLWNATEVASTQQTSLPHLFLFQAQQTPDAVAVTFEDSSLTYATLQHCASHLALILRQRGVSTETPVGLFMERSPELVMCVLAILLAGGAYVPLDPGYPRERLDFMIKQAQVALVLTRQCYLGSLSHFTSSWLDLDAGWPQLLAPASQPLPGPTALDQLAYILFTSGSTGQPKGVLASHRGTLNRLAWMAQTYPFQPGERCCQKTSLNFVDAVCELFAPLLSGYTVTIFSDDVVHNPELLLDRLAEEGIGRIVLVPSLLRLLLEAEGRLSERVPALQLWVCSGEVLPEELCRRFSVHLPDACLLNLYGSSEVAADASSYHVTMQERLRGNAPLGRPIANTRIYVLDRWGCPVPVGVSGEVYVGGRGLARGYAGHADWTAERFVPDPYSQEAGARLYRTGDLARYLPTGDLEYLGRLDQQVKLRGLRIESGEIETALSSHPAVRVAVVLLREDTPGDQRLVAYTVLHPDQTPTLEQIRQYLREKLPEYMLPSALVILDRLPLTPNGKLDRSALPVPGGRRSLKERYILPRTPIEASLVELWKDVLKVEQVGVHDNFFELGGSSLLSMHMLAGARRKGMQLEIQHLFQYQTIAQLAAFTFFAETSGQSVHVNEALVGLQTAGSKPPFVCVHPAGGEVIGYADLAYCLGPNQPFYGLRALGLDGKREPLRSIEEMAAFYIDELHTLASPGPYTLGGWSFGGLVAFEMALQLHQRGEEVALLVLLDAVTPSQMQRLPVPDTALLVREYAETLVKRSGGSLDESQCPPLLSEDDLRALDRDAQLRYLVKIAEAVGSDLLPFEKELLWKYLRVARSNSLAARRYQPRGRYSGRAVLFQVEKRESLEGSVEAKSDWEALVSGSLAVHTVPGTHQSFVHMPHVQFLAEYLTRYLP